MKKTKKRKPGEREVLCFLSLCLSNQREAVVPSFLQRRPESSLHTERLASSLAAIGLDLSHRHSCFPAFAGTSARRSFLTTDHRPAAAINENSERHRRQPLCRPPAVPWSSESVSILTGRLVLYLAISKPTIGAH